MIITAVHCRCFFFKGMDVSVSCVWCCDACFNQNMHVDWNSTIQVGCVNCVYLDSSGNVQNCSDSGLLL